MFAAARIQLRGSSSRLSAMAAADIASMEECLTWLRLVSPDDARIIWLRAEGHRWRYVCIQAGCVRQTAWRRWVAALQTIANRLKGGRRARMFAK
jgi:uncharacterized protein DUF6362